MRKFLFFLLIFTLFGFFIFYFLPKIAEIFTLQIPEIENPPQKIEEKAKIQEVIQKEIYPPPLKVIGKEKTGAILTQKGIIEKICLKINISLITQFLVKEFRIWQKNLVTIFS